MNHKMYFIYEKQYCAATFSLKGRTIIFLSLPWQFTNITTILQNQAYWKKIWTKLRQEWTFVQ